MTNADFHDENSGRTKKFNDFRSELKHNLGLDKVFETSEDKIVRNLLSKLQRPKETKEAVENICSICKEKRLDFDHLEKLCWGMIDSSFKKEGIDILLGFMLDDQVSALDKWGIAQDLTDRDFDNEALLAWLYLGLVEENEDKEIDRYVITRTIFEHDWHDKAVQMVLNETIPYSDRERIVNAAVKVGADKILEKLFTNPEIKIHWRILALSGFIPIVWDHTMGINGFQMGDDGDLAKDEMENILLNQDISLEDKEILLTTLKNLNDRWYLHMSIFMDTPFDYQVKNLVASTILKIIPKYYDNQSDLDTLYGGVLDLDKNINTLEKISTKDYFSEQNKKVASILYKKLTSIKESINSYKKSYGFP